MKIRVTPRQKLVLEMYQKDFTLTLIAHELKCSVANVSQMLSSIERRNPTINLKRKHHLRYIDYDFKSQEGD